MFRISGCKMRQRVKKRKNAELGKENEKYKSLHDNALNQIKDFNSRLEERDEITRELEAHIEQL